MLAIDLSFLPKDTTFWIVVAGCLGIVIVLAIVFGRGLNIGPFKLDRAPEKQRGKISVGKGMEAQGLKIGGDLAVIKGPSAATPADQDVDLLDSAKLKDASVDGDVAAIIKRQDESSEK